jgi:hypothetical protein
MGASSGAREYKRVDHGQEIGCGSAGALFFFSALLFLLAFLVGPENHPRYTYQYLGIQSVPMFSSRCDIAAIFCILLIKIAIFALYLLKTTATEKREEILCPKKKKSHM